MLRIPKISRLHAAGNVTMPVSKSLANRELVLHALYGSGIPTLPDGISNDVKLLHKALFEVKDSVDFEDAGTPLRLYLAYAACLGIRGVWIKGQARLTQRPIEPLLKALESLGAKFEFGEVPYQLPLQIAQATNLSSTSVEINAGISSQFVSALLLIAAKFNKGLDIQLTGEMRSQPYIDMSIYCMRRHGILVSDSSSGWKVEPVHQNVDYGVQMSVFEGDWSSGSFIYGLAALADSSEIVLTNLLLESSQGDRVCSEIFKRLGVGTVKVSEGLKLIKTGQSDGLLEIDFRHSPDLFPPVIVVAVLKGMKGKLTGISSLRDKESDRIEAMRSNLEPLGVKFHIESDALEFDGSSMIQTDDLLTLKCFNDHRIAMACSLLAFRYQVIIDQQDTVAKSFPNYWVVFRRLCGVVTQEIPE